MSIDPEESRFNQPNPEMRTPEGDDDLGAEDWEFPKTPITEAAENDWLNLGSIAEYPTSFGIDPVTEEWRTRPEVDKGTLTETMGDPTSAAINDTLRSTE